MNSIVIYAFRYCLGRASYAGPDGIDIVRAHAHELHPNDRKLIAKEIREAKLTPFTYAAEWMKLADELEEHS